MISKAALLSHGIPQGGQAASHSTRLRPLQDQQEREEVLGRRARSKRSWPDGRIPEAGRHCRDDDRRIDAWFDVCRRQRTAQRDQDRTDAAQVRERLREGKKRPSMGRQGFSQEVLHPIRDVIRAKFHKVS